MRLIDVKNMEKQIKEAFRENPFLVGMLLRWVRKQPTIDAVPVVRCKDCKHRVERGMCYMISGCPQLVGVGDNFWCAYGERKDGDG